VFKKQTPTKSIGVLVEWISSCTRINGKAKESWKGSKRGRKDERMKDGKRETRKKISGSSVLVCDAA
jgi:hypothetical protein